MDECLGSQNKSRNDTDKKWQHAAKRIHCPKTHCEWRPSHFLSYQLQKKKKKKTNWLSLLETQVKMQWRWMSCVI